MPIGALPPPFTSAPLPQLHNQAGESISMGSRVPMDVDWEEDLGENGVDTEDEAIKRRIEAIKRDVEIELEREREREIEGNGPEYEDDDIGDEEGGGEGEVLEDPMEVEDEELRGDAGGLDDPVHHAVYDDD